MPCLSSPKVIIPSPFSSSSLNCFLSCAKTSSFCCLAKMCSATFFSRFSAPQLTYKDLLKGLMCRRCLLDSRVESIILAEHLTLTYTLYIYHYSYTYHVYYAIHGVYMRIRTCGRPSQGPQAVFPQVLQDSRRQRHSGHLP